MCLQFAPIIIFAFNRLKPLQQCIESLIKNTEAKDSDLYIFVDGPRMNNDNDIENVEDVRKYIKTIKGFKSIHFYFEKENHGLGPSIIKGVNQILNLYHKAIILEDDLILSSNFLSFMNQGLEKYEKEDKIFSICGYTNKIKIPKDYKENTYFGVRSSSWGWATWSDRWNSIDWDLTDWDLVLRNKKAFNKWGGSDCFGMLRDWKIGKNKSWAIRFCYSQFIQNKISLFPIISKVINEGFDGQGTNCKKWSRFKCIFDQTNNKKFFFPENINLNKRINKSAISYHSLSIRIWSKLMYIIHS